MKDNKYFKDQQNKIKTSSFKAKNEVSTTPKKCKNMILENKNNLSIERPLNILNDNKNPISISSTSLEKSKFQRVNQEIIHQNLALHEQLSQVRKEQHLFVQENFELKGKINQLQDQISSSKAELFSIKVKIFLIF
jgi:hypothetical protein